MSPTGGSRSELQLFFVSVRSAAFWNCWQQVARWNARLSGHPFVALHWPFLSMLGNLVGAYLAQHFSKFRSRILTVVATAKHIDTCTSDAFLRRRYMDTYIAISP